MKCDNIFNEMNSVKKHLNLLNRNYKYLTSLSKKEFKFHANYIKKLSKSLETQNGKLQIKIKNYKSRRKNTTKKLIHTLKKPGNEKLVCEYIMNNIGKISLNHLGTVNSIENPSSVSGKLSPITNIDELVTENSSKKADIFINGEGVSIKQSGSCVLYNRLQRSDLINLFKILGVKDYTNILTKLDDLVNNFHVGKLNTRDRDWSEVFDESDFLLTLEFLMMKGSQLRGFSDYPAKYILTAPQKNIDVTNINCDTFNEYFYKNKNKIAVSIRRQWVGQSSNSEHRRALGLYSKQENAKWCFDDVIGEPNTGWRSESDFPVNQRKTVYFINITTK